MTHRTPQEIESHGNEAIFYALGLLFLLAAGAFGAALGALVGMR